MKARYWFLITIIIISGMIWIFSILDIETNVSRGMDFCKSNSMNFVTEGNGWRGFEYYCTAIFNDSYVEKEIKSSSKTWGFA